MKVYIVTYGDYERCSIYAVFSSLELANEYNEKQVFLPTGVDEKSKHIEEWNIDDPLTLKKETQ